MTAVYDEASIERTVYGAMGATTATNAVRDMRQPTKMAADLMIRQKKNYARELMISDQMATAAGALVLNGLHGVQAVVGKCKGKLAGLDAPTLIFLIVNDIAYVSGTRDAEASDACTFTAAEDVYARIRTAMFGKGPKHFGVIEGGGCREPWIIDDLERYACKWKIEIDRATDVQNYLIELYTWSKDKASADMPAPPWLKDTEGLIEWIGDYGIMPYDITNFTEDVYRRVRYIIFQRCSLSTQEQLDHEAQLAIFQAEQSKLTNNARRCM